MSRCKRMVAIKDVAQKLAAWAKTDEGRQRVRADAKKDKVFIADYRSAREIDEKRLRRRITI